MQFLSLDRQVQGKTLFQVTMFFPLPYGSVEDIHFTHLSYHKKPLLLRMLTLTEISTFMALWWGVVKQSTSDL